MLALSQINDGASVVVRKAIAATTESPAVAGSEMLRPHLHTRIIVRVFSGVRDQARKVVARCERCRTATPVKDRPIEQPTGANGATIKKG